MTFENMIARVRKIQEHVDEMQEIIDTLKGEKESLEASILVTLDNNPELYNVYVRKNASAGIVGRNMFKVTFSTTLARLGELELGTKAGFEVVRTITVEGGETSNAAKMYGATRYTAA